MNSFKKNLRSSSIQVLAKAENRVVASKYAKALMEIAEKHTCLETIHSDVEILSGILTDNASLCNVLGNPVVSAESKKNILEKISKQGSFNAFTNNFLKLLIEEGRLYCIEEVLEAFESLYCEVTNIKVADVYSAVKLSDVQEEEIAKTIYQLTSARSVQLRAIIDKTLIGGFLIDMGSKKLDYSLKNAFNRLEKIQEKV